jgi:hypothetical protein
MKEAITSLPPIDELDHVLRTITARLAREVTDPSISSPTWSAFEWGIARAIATMQGVAPLLAVHANWEGCSEWHRFLFAQRNHVTGRHRRIESLLEQIDFRSRQEGVALLALKGAALHAIGIYVAGDRPMADIDLLVRDNDRATAAKLLQDCGFELSFSNWRHELFESQFERRATTGYGEHTNNPIKIELHSSVRERLPVAEVDITQFMFPISARLGLNPYRSVAALMLHLLLHAASNMRAHALRYIQLIDIGRLAGRFDTADWNALLAMRSNRRSLWWAAAPLILTSRYFPNAVPESIVNGLLEECPWLLRRSARRYSLADVSWSNVRVYALPGIEWCRTLGDALRFMASRISPGHEMREEMRRFDRNEGSGGVVPWYGISQLRRIARWAFSRPQRVQTLIAVHSALTWNPERALSSDQLPKMSSTD